MIALCSCRIGGGADSGDSSGDGSSDSSGGSTDTGSGDAGSGDSGSDNTGSGDSGSSSTPQGTLFAESGTQIYLIAEQSIREQISDDSFGGVLSEVTGNELRGDSPEVAPYAHEIIIGECDRELSRKAYRALSRLDYNEPEYAGYAIYSDGNSIAVAYSNELAREYVLNLLTEEFLTPTGGKIYLGSGTLKKESFGLYKYLLAEDAKDRAAEKAAFREYLGDDAETDALLEALDAIYSIYTPDMVTWIANLYDPDIGGFYYSNSGRDTDGFLPDIESTYQAIGFLANSGVISRSELPEWLVEDMVSFTKSLQNPYDGYFYHPQWAESGVNDARRGRDLNWAERLLSDFGEEPLYPTATDRLNGEVYDPEDDGFATPVSLPLGGRGSANAALLASRVVATAAPSHLKSEAAFRAYLESFDWSPGNSYDYGNHIAAQASQIKAAKLLNVALDFFDSIINPTTGMWSDTLNNEAVNGYLKIGSLYVNSGRPIPYALTAAKGILENNMRMYAGELKGRSRDYYASTPCHLYNPWAAITNIINTMNDCGKEGNAVVTEIIALVKAEAPEQIRQTMSLALEFRKTDGSFSWQYNMNSSGSQGAAVAVSGINEGDVNSTSLSSSSVLSYIFQSMGASKYTFKMFGDAEKLLFLHTMENLGTIVKTGAVSKGVKNFEEGNAGSNLDETWRVELDTDIDSLEEEGWGYGYVDEGVLSLGRVTSGSNCYVGVFPAGKSTNSRNVMEFDLRYGDFKIWKGQTVGNVVRLSMYGGGGRFYSIYLYYNANGNLSLSENRSIELKKFEWNTLRFEYYRDTMLNFCKVYINGEYVGEYGASDESYSDLNWTKGLIEIDGSVESCRLEIDNIYMGRDDEKHETELIEGWLPATRPTVTEGDKAGGEGEYYNSDVAGKRYDYDNGESKPAQDGGNKNVIVELIESDYVLWYKQATNNESYLTYNFNPSAQPEESTAENSVGIVEFDFKMGNVNTDIPSRIGIWCGGIEAEIRIVSVDGYLMLGNKTAKPHQGSPKLNPDEWYNLRFEYYYKNATLSPAMAKIKVFLNNEYVVDINVTNVNNRAEKSDRVNIYLHKLEEAAYMCLDNLYFGYVDKAYVEPTIPEADENNGKGSYFTGALESVAGEGKDFNDSRGITKSDGLAAGATGEYTGYHYKISNGANTTGNSYVYITYPTLSDAPEYLTSIFEADIRLDGIGTEGKFGKITLCNSGKEIEITLWISDGKVYFGNAAGTPLEGLPQLEAGKWYNIRITAHYYQFTVSKAKNLGVFVSVNGSEDVEINGANCLDRTGKKWSDRAFLYLFGNQPEASLSIDNLFLGYANVNPEQCAHKDADFDTVCDVCGTTYYTAATCPGHEDTDTDTKCDVCGSDYYTEVTCPGHLDENLDTKCDRCGATYYTEETCPGHVDEGGDTKCDVCGATYYTEATCPGHLDTDLDTKCDKCGTTYYTEATCPGHVDEGGDTKCDVCGATYYTEATCPGHVDLDRDAKCDKCGTTYYTAATCPGHKDTDTDTKCDVCGSDYYTEETCPGHVDEVRNGRCDYCDKIIGELVTPSDDDCDFFGKGGNADEDGWL